LTPVRKRLTYANVAATLALLLAMSGGAMAASHYLINSTKQINPKVLKKLRGARGGVGEIGPVGPQGVTGPTGPKGTRGVTGEPGFSALSLLPSARTESGDFEASAVEAISGHTISTVVSLPIPLGAVLAETQVDFRSPTSSTDEHCAGPGMAAKGYLCVYASSLSGVEGEDAFDPEATPPVPGTGRFGFGLNWKVTETGPARATGTYSVTAP
jgi:hypothetical protein